MTEPLRRAGTLLALFFFMTFAIWLSDAPLLPELFAPHRGILETVPLWPLDLWVGVPLTSLLWCRLALYLLGMVSLVAMFAFLMNRALRLALVLLGGLLLAKLAYLSWDLRYLTGADVVHLTLTAVFVLTRRIASLRIAVFLLSLVGVINRLNPAWLNLELPEAVTGWPWHSWRPLSLVWLLAEGLAPLFWLSPQAWLRRLAVAVWLSLQALSWATLSLLWPTSLAACGPLLLVGAVVLWPLPGPLQEDFQAGPGEVASALLLGGILALTLWPGPTRGWLHVYELDGLHRIRSRVVITRGDQQFQIYTETPLARNWNPEVSTRVQATAVVAGELVHGSGRLTDALRLDATMVFSPWRFRRAAPGLLADPLFYDSYAQELVRSFAPDRLQIELDVDERRVLNYDYLNPEPRAGDRL